jgi:hypothetical protein
MRESNVSTYLPIKKNVFIASILTEIANKFQCCIFAIAKMRYCFILDCATPRTRDGST